MITAAYAADAARLSRPETQQRQHHRRRSADAAHAHEAHIRFEHIASVF